MMRITDEARQQIAKIQGILEQFQKREAGKTVPLVKNSSMGYGGAAPGGQPPAGAAPMTKESPAPAAAAPAAGGATPCPKCPGGRVDSLGSLNGRDHFLCGGCLTHFSTAGAAKPLGKAVSVVRSLHGTTADKMAPAAKPAAQPQTPAPVKKALEAGGGGAPGSKVQGAALGKAVSVVRSLHGTTADKMTPGKPAGNTPTPAKVEPVKKAWRAGGPQPKTGSVSPAAPAGGAGAGAKTQTPEAPKAPTPMKKDGTSVEGMPLAGKAIPPRIPGKAGPKLPGITAPKVPPVATDRGVASVGRQAAGATAGGQMMKGLGPCAMCKRDEHAGNC